MKSGDIKDQLRKMYTYNEWATLDELRAGTGYRGNAPSMMDVWVINCWPSKWHLTMAFEIKISRADFLVEMKDPKKRQAALDRSNQFYFAAPKDMLKPSEIPEECGLMEFEEGHAPKVKVEAPYRKSKKNVLGMAFISSLARRAAKAEDALRKVKSMKFNKEFLDEDGSVDWEKVEASLRKHMEEAVVRTLAELKEKHEKETANERR